MYFAATKLAAKSEKKKNNVKIVFKVNGIVYTLHKFKFPEHCGCMCSCFSFDSLLLAVSPHFSIDTYTHNHTTHNIHWESSSPSLPLIIRVRTMLLSIAFRFLFEKAEITCQNSFESEMAQIGRERPIIVVNLLRISSKMANSRRCRSANHRTHVCIWMENEMKIVRPFDDLSFEWFLCPL